MTEHATTDTPSADAAHPAPVAPAVDAHTNEAVSPPAPAAAEAQELIEPGAGVAPEPEPVAETHHDVQPEPVAESHAHTHHEVAAPATCEPAEPPAEGDSPKPAKKARPPRAPKAAVVVDAGEPVAHPADPGATADAPTEAPADAPVDAHADAPAEPAGTVSPSEEPAEAKPENKKKWYAIKVQSGREDTIKAAILRKVAIEGLEDSFGQIMIPFEEVIEKKTVKVKDKKTGEYTTQEKKVTRKKKKFQGYLFAELEFNDRILYLFRETSGVGDFLNLRGTPPVPEPMPEHEVQQMLTGEKKSGPGGPKKIKLEFEKGDRVRIREGSFANSEGEVKSITEPKDPTDAPKITVVVTFWGRPLDVELEYWQVAKV